jgi:exopolysaccharide production protein ExoQ
MNDASFGRIRKETRQAEISAIALLFLLALSGETGQALINNPIRTGVDGSDPFGLFSWSRYLLFAACCFSSIMRGTTFADFKPVFHLFVFVALAFASVEWSVEPVLTFKGSVNLLGTVASMAILRRRLDDETALSATINYLIICMIASAVVAVAWPEAGRHGPWDFNGLLDGEGKWRGIFLHKNALGGYSAIAVSLLLFSKPKTSRIIWRSAQISAVACLLMAGSANALLGALFGIGTRFVLLNGKYKVPLIAFGIIAGLASSVILPAIPGLVAEGLGRDPTFTGRTDIWLAALSLWSDNPLFGYGFNAAGTIVGPFLKSRLFDSAVDSHSGYIDLLLNVGAVGTIIFIFMTGLSLSRAAHRFRGIRESEVETAAIIIVAVAGIMSFGEIALVQIQGNGGQLFWWALVILSTNGRAQPVQIHTYSLREGAAGRFGGRI